jgi:Leucine-rich repeat (LRR) protein
MVSVQTILQAGIGGLEGICDLISMLKSRCTCAGNRITALPSTISNWQNLRTFSAANNKLQALPLEAREETDCTHSV